MGDSPLRNDVPVMTATHKYELGQALVLSDGKPIGTKFRWTCLCGEKGHWTMIRSRAESEWLDHLKEKK